MTLTAFVLIALEEAKYICNDQFNVSVHPPSPSRLPTQGTSPWWVRCYIQVIPSPPSAIAATTAAIMPIKP